MFPTSWNSISAGDCLKASQKVSGKVKKMRVDGGHIDLRVEFVDKDKVLAAIITELSEDFALSSGGFIEIFEEEILHRNKVTDH